MNEAQCLDRMTPVSCCAAASQKKKSFKKPAKVWMPQCLTILSFLMSSYLSLFEKIAK